jgi:lysylphosphatidylglycerol synthetase-like protein (DUF2156 family)
MFIGFYLALCGILYLIVVVVSLILLGHKIPAGHMRKFIGRYTLATLAVSLLGWILFTLTANQMGSLHIDFPQDLSDLKQTLRSLVGVFVVFLGLAGITSPVWILLFVKPELSNCVRY